MSLHNYIYIINCHNLRKYTIFAKPLEIPVKMRYNICSKKRYTTNASQCKDFALRFYLP